MTKTLAEPTADEQTLSIYNRGMRMSDSLVLAEDQLYALCLLRLNNTVQPTDYPTLKSQIEAITGIQNISLVVDHRTRATLPTDTELHAVVEINVRIEPTGAPV